VNKKQIKEIVKEILREGVEVLRVGDRTAYVTNDSVHIAAATPKIQLEGTELNAKNLSVRENAGVIEVYDEAAAAVDYAPYSHQARHIEGGADPLAGLTAAQLAAGTLKVTVPVPIPDSPQVGLAADATGVKWTSVFNLKVDPQNLLSAVIRATWTASATDSVTAIEVYDSVALAVLGSASGNTGTDAEGAVTGFTAGNIIVVRLNVTTASATAGATTDLTYAVLELTFGAS
jgi:hypothetical protein